MTTTPESSDLKRDRSGIPMPQDYVPEDNDFEPATGEDLGSGHFGQDGVMWGVTTDGTPKKVLVDDDGYVLTKLSASNVTLALVASGTATVANQYPNTGIIAQPTQLRPNYVLLFKNQSGETVSSVGVSSQTTNLPGLDATLVSLPTITPTSSGNNTGEMAELTTSVNPFVGGDGAEFTFNLSAVGTGTIEWALMGY